MRFIPYVNSSYNPTAKAMLSTNGTRYKCYAQQRGAQVKVHSEKDVSSCLIAAAVEELRAQTPNFKSALFSDKNHLRKLVKNNKKWVVLMPENKLYLERL